MICPRSTCVSIDEYVYYYAGTTQCSSLSRVGGGFRDGKLCPGRPQDEICIQVRRCGLRRDRLSYVRVVVRERTLEPTDKPPYARYIVKSFGAAARMIAFQTSPRSREGGPEEVCGDHTLRRRGAQKSRQGQVLVVETRRTVEGG